MKRTGTEDRIVGRTHQHFKQIDAYEQGVGHFGPKFPVAPVGVDP